MPASRGPLVQRRLAAGRVTRLSPSSSRPTPARSCEMPTFLHSRVFVFSRSRRRCDRGGADGCSAAPRFQSCGCSWSLWRGLWLVPKVARAFGFIYPFRTRSMTANADSGDANVRIGQPQERQHALISRLFRHTFQCLPPSEVWLGLCSVTGLAAADGERESPLRLSLLRQASSRHRR